MLLLALPSLASAAVEISFYSKEWRDTFPHAFIVLRGIDERTGQRFDASYGFTATHVSPAILFGSVQGEVRPSKPDYIAGSDEHFRFVLSDAELDSVLAIVARWKALAQPSYNLNRQNCVFFVADIAAAVNMKADRPKELMKKPRSFLQSVSASNREWLAARGALVVRETPPSTAVGARTR
ncbi:hypothetical protein SH591_10605 [Sphingomonas sp. LY54]|uniref:hypothetical protein n=1 Tax=Sphingomonas sp. LY54 TaxID=3095343 RepID=UPI002D784362|nr:hypothetical protein [Sphingomonas sp. LY54]WRP27568.1 hypothetical protein SH591_10605 [Sphingomonas sp. LY54]